MLNLQIYDTPDKGALLADFTSRLADRGFTFSTNEHGFAGLRVPLVPMQQQEAFSVYDWPGTPHVEVSDDGASAIWEGRLEDISIVPEGVSLGAFGYWRALTDVPYTALWSKTGSGGWEIGNDDHASTFAPQKYVMDNNNRLYITLKKNQTYVTAANEIAVWFFEAPHNSERNLATVAFDWDITLPSNWTFRLWSYTDSGFGGFASEQNIALGDGTQQTGSVNETITAGKKLAAIVIYNTTGSNYTNSSEDGAWYAKITNIRVKTDGSTVLASDIAAALSTYVNGVNAGQLSSSSALIEATATDLEDELYEDALPADILDRLADLHNFEAGVWEGQRLHFRQRGSASRSWQVDVTRIVDLQRSLEEIRNSAYGIYRDAGGRVLRTAAADDDASIDRYGVTRRGTVNVQTTSQTEAETHRDAFLSDRADFAVRANIEFDKVFDEHGIEHPLYMMRAGDQVTMRNLPPNVSVDIDNIRTFRVGRTEFNTSPGDSDEGQGQMKLEPRTPVPTLVTLVAKREAGI